MRVHAHDAHTRYVEQKQELLRRELWPSCVLHDALIPGLASLMQASHEHDCP